jgi:hypothetical protein
LVGGPDVWEVVLAIGNTAGRGEQRLRRLAEERGLRRQDLHLALDFYAAFPDEVDERISANERVALRLRKSVERREQLLSR